MASTVAGAEKTGEDVEFRMWTADLASSPRRELPKDRSRGATTATGYSGSMMRRRENSLNRNLDVESRAEKERLTTEELADFYIIRLGGFSVQRMHMDFRRFFVDFFT